MDQLTLSPQERALLDSTAVPLTDERRLQLADFVLAEIHEPPKRSRRMLGFLAALVATLTLTGGVAAYAWIAKSEAPKDVYTVYCYADTNPDRGADWVGGMVTAVADVNGENKPRLEALSACAESWRLGGTHLPGVVPSGENNPVPQLTACVKDGVAVVFPADETICTRLGLPTLA